MSAREDRLFISAMVQQKPGISLRGSRNIAVRAFQLLPPRRVRAYGAGIMFELSHSCRAQSQAGCAWFMRLKIPALLPESPYHAGSDAALLQM